MKLVVDMNLSTDWVSALRAAGIEAVHWATLGPLEASDSVIMAWAHANQAIVLTRDLDFAAALMMQGRSSPSVIQLRIDQVRPERHLPLVQRALALYGRHLEQGAVVILEEDRVRVRVLDANAQF
jgi:predicted nuclease of predicted toxin-antitoxin system